MNTGNTRVYHLHPGSADRKAGIIADALCHIKASRDFRKVLCLFPTRNHLRHWQEKVFHPFAGDCHIPPSMLTLGNFATKTASGTEYEILDTALRPAIISILTGQGPGFSTLASEFTGELKLHFPGAGPDEIRSRLIGAFEECNIPDEVSSHAMKAMDAFDSYEASISDKGFIDREDAYNIAAGQINDKGLASWDIVVLEGFYELSPAELLLVKSIINASGSNHIFVPVSGNDNLAYCYTNGICDELGIRPEEVLSSMPPPEPRLNPAHSRDSEVEAMARHIKQSHLSGANRNLEDTLVVFPDLKPYASTLRRVFERYGVPLKQDSIRRLKLMNGPQGDLMSMIRSVADGFPRLEFSRFLLSPHFKKIPSDIRLKVPEAALNSGVVKGRHAWQKALATESSGWVFRTLEPLVKLKDSSTFEGFIKVLRDILDAFLFHPAESSPDEVLRALERMRPCGTITGQRITLEIFADTLESLLGPGDQDEVSHGIEAGSILDVRGLEPEVLYMGGLKDGEIPSRPDIDLLLPDSVRRKIGLVDIERYMALQEKIFTRLRMSARELYLSYPSQEEDKVFLPSAFLAGIKPSPYPVAGHYCMEESMTAWGGDSLSPRLREITLPGAYGRERTLSVTEIDSYRRCPRRFAIERVMGLNPTVMTDYEMEPTELGSIAHRVMENMITGHPGTLDEFRQRAEEAIEAALSECDIDRFFSSLIRESLIRLVPEIHELETALSEEGFKVREKEITLEGQPDKDIKIRGKADRIDLSAEGKASIIDYKTGTASISAQALVDRGENLQLFLYAALLRDMGIETQRVGIYSLKDIKVKWVPGKRDLKKGTDMEYCMDTALSYLRDTVSEIRDGRFPASPISGNVCNSCNEVPFCPYFQSASNAADNNTNEINPGGPDAG